MGDSWENRGQTTVLRFSTNGNYVLGDQKFAAEIEQALGKRVSQGVPGRPKSVS